MEGIAMPLMVKRNRVDKVHTPKEFTKDGQLLLGMESVCVLNKENMERAIKSLKEAGYDYKVESVICDGMGLLYRSDVSDRETLINNKYLRIPASCIYVQYDKSDGDMSDSIFIRISHNRFSHILDIPSNKGVMWLSRYMEDKDIDGLFNYHYRTTLFNGSVDLENFMNTYQIFGMETDSREVKLKESYFNIPLA